MKHSGGCAKFRFAEDLRNGKLDGEACVLRCIYLLFVCLLFIYFYGAACWFMHQLCGLAPLEGWGGGGYFCDVVLWFWWVSSGLFFLLWV